MPYIDSKNDRRERLRNEEPALNAGELNYQIFHYVKHNQPINVFKQKIIYKFVKQFLGEKPNYQRYNDMTGCLIRCLKEIDRRLGVDVDNILIPIMESYDDEIAKYEDLKCSQNGDVE